MTGRLGRIAGVLACAGLLACGRGKERPQVEPPAYARASDLSYTGDAVARTPAQVRFTDVTAEAGIEFVHETGAFGRKWMPETMGSGCALFDYDGDGWLDIFLVDGSYWPGHEKTGRPGCRLYRNRGNGTFEDVSRQAGLDGSAYGMGVAVADYDADGDPDLYLTTVGRNRLWRNEHGRFVDVAGPAGVAGASWQDGQGRSWPEWSTAAAWVDVDGDGWLDLFVGHYVRWSPESDLFTTLDGVAKSYATPQQYPGSTCRLYRNLGNGRFAEITRQAGLELPQAKTLGVAIDDFDRDGAADLVVTNDTQPNYLLHNLGQGRFEEIGLAAGIAYDETGRARAGMGVDIASIEDGRGLAIAVGNFSREPVSLYDQTAAGVFIDRAGAARLVQPTLPSLTFGLRFLDVDLDGYPDLVLANGHIEPGVNEVQRDIRYAQPLQLFWNDGRGRFADLSGSAGDLGRQPLVGRGLACGDYDLDGDLDLLVSTNSGPPHLLRNDGAVGQAVFLHLRGAAPNRDALGAVVTASAAGREQRQMVRSGSSYLSHSDPVLAFGLGQAGRIGRLRIQWPDRTEEVLDGVEAGAHYWVEQGQGIVQRRPFGRRSG